MGQIMRNRLACFAISLLVADVAFGEGNHKELAYADRPITSLQLPPSVVGDGYEPMGGFQLNDFSDIASLPKELQGVASKLKKDFAPLGVVALGDFSVFLNEAPFNGVTVRVFIFDTPENRENWCRKKYGYDGWEKHYQVVDNEDTGTHVLDSTQTNKRIFQFDRVWLTSHQLQDGTEHHKAARHIIDQLTTPGDL